MKIKNIAPDVVQLKFYQEKTDSDYGSCLWGNVIIDCANYTLLIESDCGSYAYGWTPTPNTESFIRLLCRMNSDYLLGKISDMTCFDFEKSKEQTYENIREYFEYDDINGKPYSLPFQKPWTNITNDEAAKACFSKGEGWHLMTAAEWGLVANISLKNGTLPHGNTNCGKYNSDETEKGTKYDDYRTLTGSGPVTWTHNHLADGVHDLCGNIWEIVRGLRIKDGMLQATKNNDAAIDIDLSEISGDWLPVCDDENNAVYASVSDGNIILTTDEDIAQEYDGGEWDNVETYCKSEQLHEFALYEGEPNAYCYIDSTDGEYFPRRGGHWGDGTSAGVCSISFNNPRSHVNVNIGFRSAYYKKH